MSSYTKVSLIDIEIIDDDEMDDLLARIEYTNCIDHYIMPYKEENNNNKLTFMYVETQINERNKVSIDDIFGRKVLQNPIDINKLSRYEMSVMTAAKKLLIKDRFRGIGVPKWTNKSSDEIMSDIEKLIGFSDFKQGMKEIKRYIENVNMFSKNNYNVILVKSCEVDEDMFIEHIYNLYVSSGIITDPTLVEGDLDDCQYTERDTRFMYKICEEWCENNAIWVTMTNQQRIFNKISKRNTIYITTMDNRQYEKMKQNDSFTTLFPQVIFINDITKEEKVEFIKRELMCYGFLLDMTDFEKSPLIDNPLEKIKSQISVFVRNKLKSQKCDFLVNVDDFDALKNPQPTKSAFDELDSLIGLESVKSFIKQIATLLKNKGKDALPCIHMVFRGNPGTGKTTVARIIGKIFSEIGIIKNTDKFIEADRNKLVSQYLGGTAQRTSDVIKSAIGGVLFIDEAYSLNNGERYDYGNEAVAVLVKLMEDYRKDFVCIMAGYTKEMDEMLNMNPGLRERVQFYIDFPDYNANELGEIFYSLCKENKYKLNENVKAIVNEYFEKITKNKDSNFANGRIARKVFERIKLKQALRSKGNVIVKRDIMLAFEDNDLLQLTENNGNKKVIGFN